MTWSDENITRKKIKLPQPPDFGKAGIMTVLRDLMLADLERGLSLENFSTSRIIRVRFEVTLRIPKHAQDSVQPFLHLPYS